MSVFATGMNHRSYYWQITVLCFVLGVLGAAAWHTATQVSRAGDGPRREGFVYNVDFASKKAAEKAADYEDEIKRLGKRNQELENKLATRNSATQLLNEDLTEKRVFAGLTEVAGPGIQVTLSDSMRHSTQPGDPLSLNNLIHDVDIAQVVNELKASGAEAIAVNGQRIISISTFRCVGPVIQVNGVPASPPYVIQAIGDPETLYGGVNLPVGVLDQIRRIDAMMVHVDRRKQIRLPAYAGSTRMRFVHPADDSTSAVASKDNR